MTEPAPKPAPAAKVETKPKVSWGEIGLTIRDKFACHPEPKVADGSEAFLLQDNAQFSSLMKHLKEQNFPVLLLIDVVEYKEAFQVIYQLQRIEPDYRLLFVKVNLSKENPELQSLVGLWASADWYEREIWDLHGIKFQGHPNLKRLLNPDQWEGFPMRKDYIPPLDALNGPITAVKGNQIGNPSKSTRADVEVIEEPNQVQA